MHTTYFNAHHRISCVEVVSTGVVTKDEDVHSRTAKSQVNVGAIHLCDSHSLSLYSPLLINIVCLY